MACVHNQRTRYTTGFQCNDMCGKFFEKSSPTYRKGELLGSIWMALRNINADIVRTGKEINKEIYEMSEKVYETEWAINVRRENLDYEKIISESLELLKKYDCDEKSASITVA